MMISATRYTEFDTACEGMAESWGRERLLELHERGQTLLGAGKGSVTTEAHAVYTHAQAKVARLASMIERLDRRKEWDEAAPEPKTGLLFSTVCVEHSRKDTPYLGFMASKVDGNRASVDLDVLESRLKAKGIGHARLYFARQPYLVVRKEVEVKALAIFMDMCDEVTAKTAHEVYDTRVRFRSTQTDTPLVMNTFACDIRWVG